MDSKELKKVVREVLAFVATLPEEYRLKTYEVLLTQRLLGLQIGSKEFKAEKKEADDSWTNTVPIEVRAFLKTHEISVDVLDNLFLVEENRFVGTYKIVTTANATAQIQITCLAALEHALQDGVFEFSIEDIRQRVRNFDHYDTTNFMSTFRVHERMFVSLDDHEHIELSSDGMMQLAKVILEITK